MNNLPNFSRYIVRRQDQPDFEQELWQPTWQCFCCQDKGIVNPHLVRKVIPDYVWHADYLPLCQNPACKASKSDNPEIEDLIDYRFTEDVCQTLDAIAREDWRKTTAAQFAKIKERIEQQSQALADTKSLRTRARTDEEEMMAQQNHTNAIDNSNVELSQTEPLDI